jgi:hypothetical protein
VKILIIGLLLTTAVNAQNLADSVVTSVISNTITSGLNPVTHDPLPGSDWTVSLSAPNAGTCSEFSATDNIFNDGPTDFIDIQYVPISNTTCSGVVVTGDVLHTAVFNNLGMVQESFFNTEDITCNLTSQCAVTLVDTVSNQKFAHFTPTSGTSGSESGQVNSFLYNYNSLIFSTISSIGGTAGTSNMTVPNTSVKYCVLKRDQVSDGNSSNFAKNPEINIQKIFWTPYTQGANGISGFGTGSALKKSNVIKGLDYSQIYWLGQDNILGF